VSKLLYLEWDKITHSENIQIPNSRAQIPGTLLSAGKQNLPDIPIWNVGLNECGIYFVFSINEIKVCLEKVSL
jgi:hypothetical protein